MHDLKLIRDNPAAFDAARARRGLAPVTAQILELDAARRAVQTRLQEAQSRRNAISKDIGAARAKKDEARASELMAEMAALKDSIPAFEREEGERGRALEDLLATLPNLPQADVPLGTDETGNVEVRRHGTPRTFEFEPKEHFELGEALGLMDFERAARISGARFVVLKGALARLERALGQFMLDLHTTEYGYAEMQPPILVRDQAAFGTGQLPKFAEDLFHTDNGFWLIPTAEVPLTNMLREDIIEEKRLPIRMTALTPCFRSEAGAAGKDTRGMIRQHQFNKVELVSITTPEQSPAEHERMTACAEEVLKRLGLPFRTMLLCAGDMGFASTKTYDIEVWLPGQKQYREISSCSDCGDFQARRMNTRFRPRETDGKKVSNRMVHTLNGSGVAVGRALIAVMENYQQSDGSILVPEVLRPYMGGVTRIARVAE